MGGEKPKTILTDQDAAMAKAISLNALRHVNHLYQKSSRFRLDFEACIDLHEEESEFLNEWNSLLVDHNVLKDSWLHSIFKLKEKWAWAYVQKTFTADMRSTQLSESFNADLKNHLKSDINLVQFFTHFKRAVNAKHNNELEAEYDSRHKLPKLKMKKARMLLQAVNVYTPKNFEEFQEEYEEYQDTCIKEVKEGLYVVPNYDNEKERMVMGNPMEQKVSCDCRKFETHGILCSHALKVLDVMNIKLIPEHYILKRWTRDARLGSNQGWSGRHVELDQNAHFMKRYNELCPQLLKLINRASESHETYTFLSKVYEESNKTVNDMLSKKYLDGESSGMVHVSISIANDEVDNNIDTVGKAKGIKTKDCPPIKLHNQAKQAMELNIKIQSKQHNQAKLTHLTVFVLADPCVDSGAVVIIVQRLLLVLVEEALSKLLFCVLELFWFCFAPPCAAGFSSGRCSGCIHGLLSGFWCVAAGVCHCSSGVVRTIGVFRGLLARLWLGFGKIFGGKGWFSYGVKVKVRSMSLVVEIGEDFVVFGLG
ncbi:protein FAR1-RELATED SEQUENCE 5-like [Medicago truncatula]|uniref:protein FAR1-RELATED SEQUENCE 5-like n=1 Tax=Medicago truncatula TaxID=3880 RepID=UPI0019675F34|nr:protein FAR1-RELATED SEQUENCE 5-like [Medicago truncatula]